MAHEATDVVCVYDSCSTFVKRGCGIGRSEKFLSALSVRNVTFLSLPCHNLSPPYAPDDRRRHSANQGARTAREGGGDACHRSRQCINHYFLLGVSMNTTIKLSV